MQDERSKGEETLGKGGRFDHLSPMPPEKRTQSEKKGDLLHPRHLSMGEALQTLEIKTPTNQTQAPFAAAL